MDKNDQSTPTPDDRIALLVLRSVTIAELREEGEDFLSDLIELFLTETPARLALLATAIAEGDRTDGGARGPYPQGYRGGPWRGRDAGHSRGGGDGGAGRRAGRGREVV